MFFRKKSKGEAAPPPKPAPVITPMAPPGEPDMRGLGRVLWARKARIFGVTLMAAAVAFAVVNAVTPRYRSE